DAEALRLPARLLRRRPLLLGAARTSRAAPSSDVEADVQDVAVLDLVGLAFEPLEAAAGGLRVRARLDQVVPADDLAADDAARDVGVDGRGGLERRLPTPERPRARLVLGGGEEADQVERREQPADDLVERGEALAEGGRLVGREFGELRFELQVGAARAVLERDERLG